MRMLNQFLRFALVGGVATSIQYVVLFGLVHWADSGPVLASGIGYCLSAVVNYVLNYLLTFKSNASHGDAAAKFVLIALLGLALNSLVMKLLMHAEFHYLIAQIGATVIVLFWNFAGGRYWAFRGRTGRDHAS